MVFILLWRRIKLKDNRNLGLIDAIKMQFLKRT